MTGNEYLNDKEALLNRVEQQIQRATTPILEGAFATYDPETAEEECLGPLNDALRAEISAALFRAQSEMSSLAMRAYPGRPARMQSPEELIQSIRYGSQNDPVPLVSWLARQSPSRWMRDLFKGSAAKIRNSVNSLIEGCCLELRRPHRTDHLELSQTGTCPVCVPLDGRVERRMEDFPVPYPVHPRCKCGVIRAPL